ncbi:MAG: hypothetical protein JNM21_07055 [Taibaiella sp.]|nr:hypothetical protein [Taibaiella sp.]
MEVMDAGQFKNLISPYTFIRKDLGSKSSNYKFVNDKFLIDGKEVSIYTLSFKDDTYYLTTPECENAPKNCKVEVLNTPYEIYLNRNDTKNKKEDDGNEDDFIILVSDGKTIVVDPG